MDKKVYALDSELLTTNEISSLLKTKEKTIRQWVYQGKIPSVKINGLRRFSRMQINQWIAQQIAGRQS